MSGDAREQRRRRRDGRKGFKQGATLHGVPVSLMRSCRISVIRLTADDSDRVPDVRTRMVRSKIIFHLDAGRRYPLQSPVWIESRRTSQISRTARRTSHVRHQSALYRRAGRDRRCARAHRVFLERQFAAGVFVIAGPKVPREGGIIVASAIERDRLDTILAEDPFAQQKLAHYDVIEFKATRLAPSLNLPMPSRSVTKKRPGRPLDGRAALGESPPAFRDALPRHGSSIRCASPKPSR